MRWANQVSAKLDESRMLATEKVFGFLSAAIAVQLILDGLASAGWSDLSSLSHAVPVTRAATREAGKPPVTGVILIIFAVWMVLE